MCIYVLVYIVTVTIYQWYVLVAIMVHMGMSNKWQLIMAANNSRMVR